MRGNHTLVTSETLLTRLDVAPFRLAEKYDQRAIPAKANTR